MSWARCFCSLIVLREKVLFQNNLQLNKSLLTTCVASRFVHDSVRTVSLDEIKQRFKPVYELPRIRFLGPLAKIKRYPLIVAAVASPVLCLLEWQGVLENNFTFSYTASLAIFGSSLFIHSHFFLTNLIGKVYISHDKTEAVISYLDLFGNRTNRLILIDNIAGYDDTKTHLIKIRIEGDNEKNVYRLRLKTGKILNAEDYKMIFGEFITIKK